MFAIKIAIDVNRAVPLDIKMPALGFNFANVLELIVEADSNKISLKLIGTFFLLKFYIFAYNNLYWFLEILKYFHYHISVFSTLDVWSYGLAFLFSKVTDQYSNLDMPFFIQQMVLVY